MPMIAQIYSVMEQLSVYYCQITPKDMVVEGENVPHFSKMIGDKMRAQTGLSMYSNLGRHTEMTASSTYPMGKP